MVDLYPALKPVCVELRLDAIDSCGRAVGAMHASTARPMACAFGAEPMWYSFAMNDPAVTVIEPGTTVTCIISFINHDGAIQAMHRGASVLFGDGACTRGVIKIISFD